MWRVYSEKETPFRVLLVSGILVFVFVITANNGFATTRFDFTFIDLNFKFISDLIWTLGRLSIKLVGWKIYSNFKIVVDVGVFFFSYSNFKNFEEELSAIVFNWTLEWRTSGILSWNNRITGFTGNIYCRTEKVPGIISFLFCLEVSKVEYERLQVNGDVQGMGICSLIEVQGWHLLYYWSQFECFIFMNSVFGEQKFRIRKLDSKLTWEKQHNLLMAYKL